MTILDVNNNSFYNKFEYNIENAVEALKKEFGQQFSISKSVREQHTSTTTVHTPELPDGVDNPLNSAFLPNFNPFFIKPRGMRYTIFTYL